MAANPAMARCLGTEIGALVGARLTDRAVDGAALAGFLGGDEPSREFRFRTGDGGERVLALTLAREALPEGDILSAFDATAHRAAQTRLQDELERYLDMISAASDLFHELHGAPDGTVRLFLPRRVNGTVTIKEVNARWPEECADTSYDPEGFAAWMRTVAAREPYRGFVFRVLRKDGKEQYLRSSAVPYHDKAGIFRGFRGLSIDVTAQVFAERALRDSEARLRRSQQHLEQAQRVAATASSALDLASGVEEWSDGMYRLFGLDRHSFSRTVANALMLVHAEDRPTVEGGIALSRKGIRPRPGEFRIIRPDGETRTIYCEADLICDEAGKPARMMFVFKDVSELRAAERGQREMEGQLHHAQKLEALGTLAGGVAHELNNALVPVRALAKLTAGRLPAGSRERDNLLTILRASERARGLVAQILAFSRKEEPTRQAIDLAELARDTVRLMRASLPATLRIEEAIEPVPAISASADQLRQVIVNLVTNAAQAIGATMGRITVAVAGADEGACLLVEDTGCGMDAATKARVFEPFFTTKEVGQGTGLGLSVAHGIVTSYGGRIEVDSRPGDGTRFSVYLPLAGASTNPERAA